jgi:hypothetical protein
MEPELRSTYTVAGDSRKGVPPEFDAGHPLAEDIKRRDFILSSRLADRLVPAA